METQQLPDPPEVEIGRAVLPLLRILDQEMDDIFQDLIAAPIRRPIERQRARVANCIVILCRNLADEMRRYEHLCWLDEDDRADDLTEEDLDF
jgi:hypothetical protein